MRSHRTCARHCADPGIGFVGALAYGEAVGRQLRQTVAVPRCPILYKVFAFFVKSFNFGYAFAHHLTVLNGHLGGVAGELEHAAAYKGLNRSLHTPPSAQANAT